MVAANAAGNALHFVALPTVGEAANELSVLSALPSIAGYERGDIINVGGELYELKQHSDDANVYRGQISGDGPSGAHYQGDATFEWEGQPPYNIRVNLPKSILGGTPPMNLYVEVTISDGETTETQLGRAPAQDT